MKFSRTVIISLVALSFTYACRTDHHNDLKQMDSTTRINQDSVNKLANLSSSTRITNRTLSKEYAYKALALANQINSAESFAIAYKALGAACFNDQNDSAFIYYSKALKISDSANYTAIRIRCMYSIARLYTIAFNYKPAVVLFDSVIHLAQSENDFISVSDAYNSLGTIHGQLEDSINAKEMFQKAFDVAKKHRLFREQGNALANLASSETNPYHAIDLTREAMTLLKNSKGAEQELATMMINMGHHQQSPDSAIFYYQSALKIAEPANLKEIQFAAYNAMAGIYIEKGEVDIAEKYITEHSIPLAKDLNNPAWLAIAYDSYADVIIHRNDFKSAFENEKKALRFQRQVDPGKARGQVRLLTAILDLKNKEAIIYRNENDIRTQEARLQQMKLFLLISILILIGSLWFILWLRQHSRIKIQQAKIESAKKIIEIDEMSKGRLARELHDTIGHLVQGLTGYIASVQISDQMVNLEISGKLNDLGENIRRISHQMSQVATDKFSFNELITGLCEDVQSLTGLKLQYSIPAFPKRLPEELNLHVYRIVQELLTNANKYAGNAIVRLNFALVEKTLLLVYKDDGPGFETECLNSGSFGLQNIFERVKLLGGSAVLKSSPGNGTLWNISIPVIQS
jgi:signal transduction histidine kinase